MQFDGIESPLFISKVHYTLERRVSWSCGTIETNISKSISLNLFLPWRMPNCTYIHYTYIHLIDNKESNRFYYLILLFYSFIIMFNVSKVEVSKQSDVQVRETKHMQLRWCSSLVHVFFISTCSC